MLSVCLWLHSNPGINVRRPLRTVSDVPGLFLNIFTHWYYSSYQIHVCFQRVLLNVAHYATPKHSMMLITTLSSRIPWKFFRVVNKHPAYLYIWDICVKHKEPNQFGQLMRMIGLCMRTALHPIRINQIFTNYCFQMMTYRKYIFFQISATIRRILLQVNILHLSHTQSVCC